MRLYFYAGQEPVRLVHTIVFDGDQEKDFIRGLGLAFAVPMREQVHNRHVRFSGEGDGLWSRAVQPLTGAPPLCMPGSRTSVYADQLAGKRVPNKEAFNAARAEAPRRLGGVGSTSSWRSPTPTASPSRSAPIRKAAGWMPAPGGAPPAWSSSATCRGGLAVGVKNFWQSYPASLEVRNATSAAAELRVWLWSPDAPAMDLRHYDTARARPGRQLRRRAAGLQHRRTAWRAPAS